MLVDDHLLQLLQDLEGYWTVKPEGKATFEIIKAAYKKGNTINVSHFGNGTFVFWKTRFGGVTTGRCKIKITICGSDAKEN